MYLENINSPEDLKKYGFIPELIGRMPVITSTNDLTKDDMIRILKEPKNALIKQYQKLMSIDGIELSFTDSAIDKIVEYALDVKTGARGLRRIMEKVLSNVKMRGGIGEVQLAMLLEQILAPDQYEANVKTKKVT